MDVMELLDQSDLVGSLKGLGLDDSTISELGSAISGQLSGGAGIEAMVTGLDVNEIVQKLDIGKLAAQVGISPQLAQSAVALIAPKLAALLKDESALGKLKSLKGKLFGG
jgi:hypothetical protein